MIEQVSRFLNYFKNHYMDYFSIELNNMLKKNAYELCFINNKLIINNSGGFFQNKNKIPIFDIEKWCDSHIRFVCETNENIVIMQQIKKEIIKYEEQLNFFINREKELINEYNKYVLECPMEKMCIGIITEDWIKEYNNDFFNKDIYFIREDNYIININIYNGSKYIPVTNNLMEKWGKITTFDKINLLNYAKENQINLFEYDFEEIKIHGESVYFIITNSAYDLGVLLTPNGPLYDIAEEIDDNLYVVFSSNLEKTDNKKDYVEIPYIIPEHIIINKEFNYINDNNIIFYDKEENVIVTNKDDLERLTYMKKDGYVDAADRYDYNYTNNKFR